MSAFDPFDKSHDPDLIPKEAKTEKGLRWDIIFSQSPAPFTLHVLDGVDVVEPFEDRIRISFKRTGTEAVIYKQHIAAIMRTPFTRSAEKPERTAKQFIKFKGDQEVEL